MKDNQQVKPVINVEDRTITFEFRDAEPLVFHVDRAHPDVMARAALVGMAQVRLADAAAVSRQSPEGIIRTADEMISLKRAGIERLIQHYESGAVEWSPARSEGGGRSSEGGLTLRAVAAVQGLDILTMTTRIAELAEKRETTPRAILAKLATAPAVVAEIARIRAERPMAADAEEMLEELAG
jgi:hypothetical protein